MDRRPTEGPAASSDRDATIDTACRCYLANEAQMLASARRHLRLAGLEHEDPEDVWSDAQLKILDQLSAGRRLVAEPGDTQQDAYLRYAHTVLKLHVNDLRKKAIRRRTETTDSLDAQVGGADVWQQTAHNMALLDWRRALLARSDRTRKVLAMTELGYSRQEIAEELGVSVKRVGKIQEQGKPLRERVLASRGAKRLQEICGGLAVTSKLVATGGAATVLTIIAIGAVGRIALHEDHAKQPVAAAEHGQAPHAPRHVSATPPRPAHTTPTSPATTTATRPRTTTATRPRTTTATRPRTTARTVAVPARSHAPAPARATQSPTAIGVLCTTQQVCHPSRTPAPTGHRTTAASTPAPARPRARPAVAPANLCVQQGLCRSSG